MAQIEVYCPICNKKDVVKYGSSSEGKQRFLCKNTDCCKKTFILDYTNKGHLLSIKKQIINMAINGSGIRDTARVLGIGINTVMSELKKSTSIRDNK